MNTTDRSRLRLDWLISPSCRLYQCPDHFRFNSDTAALALFCCVRSGDRILDIGTNNGALLVYFDQFEPALLYGVEILQEPSQIARLNMETFVHADWVIENKPVSQMENLLFDLVVCNPPYFKPEKLDQETVKDLRHQGRFSYTLDLGQMIEQASRHLADGGRLCFVHRQEVLADAFEKMKQVGLYPSRLQIAADARTGMPKAILVEGVKNVERDLKVEKLFWYGKNDQT